MIAEVRHFFRIQLNFEDDHEIRLSILKLDKLNVCLQILCISYVARVSSNDDHLWIPFLTKYNHSYNIAQPSLMITFSTNSHDI